jgi:hypothetical protein
MSCSPTPLGALLETKQPINNSKATHSVCIHVHMVKKEILSAPTLPLC